MLESWTSLGHQDPFSRASGGRSWFRPDDLLRLSELIGAIERRRDRVK